jgi:glutathione S-transferase
VEPRWFAGQALPALHAWLAAWLGSGLFMACMSKLAPQAVVAFPGHRSQD